MKRIALLLLGILLLLPSCSSKKEEMSMDGFYVVEIFKATVDGKELEKLVGLEEVGWACFVIDDTNKVVKLQVPRVNLDMTFIKLRPAPDTLALYTLLEKDLPDMYHRIFFMEDLDGNQCLFSMSGRPAANQGMSVFVASIQTMVKTRQLTLFMRLNGFRELPKK